MKKNMNIIFYSLIIVNLLLTISTTIFIVELIKKAETNLLMVWLTLSVFLFMFIFSGGMITLSVNKNLNDNNFLIIGILNSLPIPYLSIVSMVVTSLLIVKIKKSNTEKIDNKNNLQNITEPTN